MKTVTSKLESYLNTKKHFVSCDLYELQLANGNTYYYADCDQDIVFGGNTYLHNALLIKRQQTKINDRVVVDTMTITISANSRDLINGKPILLAAHDGLLDRARLFLRRCFFEGGTVLDAVELFGGIAEVKKCGGIGLELTVKAKTQGLAQEFPLRRYYPQGTYSTTDGVITSDDETNDYVLIAPFVPLKEVLI
jgi:hypothetical protein